MNMLMGIFCRHPCGIHHPAEKNYTVCFATFSVLMACAFLTALQFRYDFHNSNKDIALAELTEKVKDKVSTESRSKTLKVMKLCAG
jgi:hypothetical protein